MPGPHCSPLTLARSQSFNEAEQADKIALVVVTFPAVDEARDDLQVPKLVVLAGIDTFLGWCQLRITRAPSQLQSRARSAAMSTALLDVLTTAVLIRRAPVCP